MNFDYPFVGWDNSEKAGKKHDKIWGVAILTRKYGAPAYVFFGRRGKTLKVMQHEQGHALDLLRDSKERKGYHEINQTRLGEIWPDLESLLEQEITMCALAGNKYSKIENNG